MPRTLFPIGPSLTNGEILNADRTIQHEKSSSRGVLSCLAAPLPRNGRGPARKRRRQTVARRALHPLQS